MIIHSRVSAHNVAPETVVMQARQQGFLPTKAALPRGCCGTSFRATSPNIPVVSASTTRTIAHESRRSVALHAARSLFFGDDRGANLQRPGEPREHRGVADGKTLTGALAETAEDRQSWRQTSHTEICSGVAITW